MYYYIRLSEMELGSLAWCAGRYESARILHDALELAGDRSGDVFRVSEAAAWQARDAIAEDGGDSYESGGFIPCLDSPAIRDLFERLV